MTKKAIENCKIVPKCENCKKYSKEYIDNHFWNCDKTCKVFVDKN